MGFLPSNYAIRNTLDTESVIIRTFVNGKSYSIEILVRILNQFASQQIGIRRIVISLGVIGRATHRSTSNRGNDSLERTFGLGSEERGIIFRHLEDTPMPWLNVFVAG